MFAIKRKYITVCRHPSHIYRHQTQHTSNYSHRTWLKTHRHTLSLHRKTRIPIYIVVGYVVEYKTTTSQNILPSLLPLLPHHTTNIQHRVISCLTCDSKKSRFAKSAMAQTRLIYVHKVVYRLINTVELNVLSLFLTLAIYKALKYMMAIVSMFTQDIRPQFILTYFYYFPSVYLFPSRAFLWIFSFYSSKSGGRVSSIVFTKINNNYRCN